MKAFRFFLIILSTIILFSSCKVFQPNKMFKTKSNYSYSDFKPSEVEYKIKTSDKLSIRITTNDGFKLINIEGGQQQLQGMEYLVEFDGKVKVPTLGRIDIAGLTLREAEKKLEELYKEFYQSPFVQISVTNRRVIIFSQGSESGTVVNIDEENFTLIEALAQVGGISNNGKSYKIKLIRGSLNNPEIFIYNVSSIKDMQKANFLLQANDIIYVESRPRYVSKVLEEITPYLSLLTSMLLIYGLLFKAL